MFSQLMTSRRFAPLFWTQFFSAFNDNFVRNMLAMLSLFRLGADQGGLVTLAVALFILPSIFLSAPGGEIADSSDKALIARRLKFAEIFVQMIAAAGFFLSSIVLLYAALFGLGVHPTVGRGTPLTLALLSPAHRPIQITRDLPGFWAGSWAAVRTDMRGQYPRHVWPDDPANAAPTARAKPRGT